MFGLFGLVLTPIPPLVLTPSGFPTWDWLQARTHWSYSFIFLSFNFIVKLFWLPCVTLIPNQDEVPKSNLWWSSSSQIPFSRNKNTYQAFKITIHRIGEISIQYQYLIYPRIYSWTPWLVPSQWQESTWTENWTLIIFCIKHYPKNYTLSFTPSQTQSPFEIWIMTKQLG